MKNYKNIFFITLCCSLFLIACYKKEPINYAIVSGTMTNTEGKEFFISSNEINFGIDTLKKIKHTIKFNNKGFFSDTLYIQKERSFVFVGEGNYIGLKLNTGDHLQLEADADNLKSSLVFKGKQANKHTYLLKKAALNKKKEDASRAWGRKFDKDAYTKAYEYYNEALGLLNLSTGLSDEFVINEKKDIKYGLVLSYLYIERANSNEYKDQNAPLADNFEEIVSSVDFENIEEYKRSSMYGFLLRGNSNIGYGKTIDDPWETDPINHLKYLVKNVKNKDILEELFIMFAKYDITRTKELQAYYNLFMDNVSNKLYKEKITSVYNDLNKLNPGQPSPEFTNCRNIDGSKTSLKDFRGKYVYIDVWATWCGPCKAEIPFLKEVEKKYYNKNIEFVSFSIDSEKDFKKWQDFVKKEELGGVQIITDKANTSEFVDKYQIMGIPQFILIDTEGNIVKADAPRPSDEKLIELFNEIGI